MGVGLLGRKSDAFAALLDGTATGTPDPALLELSKLVQRLSAVPAPTSAFRDTLRDQLVGGATTAPPGPATPGGGSDGGGAGGGSGGGSGSAGTGTAGSGSATGTAGGGASGATGAAGASGATGAAGAAGGAGATGSAFSAAVAAIAKSAPLWVKLAVAGTAIAVSGTGVGVSAHRALPGDFFYGVKRQVENVQIELAAGAQEKALTQLGFAHARADEIQALIKRAGVRPGEALPADVAAHVRSALEDWAQEAGEGTTALVKQIRALGSDPANAVLSSRLRERLREFTTQQFAQLGGTLAALPTGAVQSLTASALGYLQRVDRVVGGNPAALVESLSRQLQVPLTSLPDIADLDTVLHLAPGTVNGTPFPLPLTVPSVALPGSLPSPGLPLPSVGVPSLPLPSLAGPTLPRSVGPVPLPSLRVSPGALPTLPPSLVPPVAVPTGQLPGAVRSLGGAVDGVGKSVGGAVKSVGGAVGDVGTNVGGAVGGTVDRAGGAVAGAGKTVTGTLGSITGAAGGAVGGTAGAAGKAGSGVVNGTVGTVTGGITGTAGPALPLPTAVPTLPPLPGIGGLGR